MAKIGFVSLVVKKELEEDYWGTMEKVAKLGIQGTELRYLPQIDGLSVREIKKRFDAIGMEIITASGKIEEFKEKEAEIIENAHILGAKYVGLPWTYCESMEWFQKEMPFLNEFGKRLHSEGLQFVYHNHNHEFNNVFDGKRAIELFFDMTDEKYVKAEVDVAWVHVGGDDPAEFLRGKKGRCPLVHMKDVIMLDGKPQFVELGTGEVDFPSVLEAVNEIEPEWMILEQDSVYKLPGLESLAVSYGNLTKLMKK